MCHFCLYLEEKNIQQTSLDFAQATSQSGCHCRDGRDKPPGNDRQRRVSSTSCPGVRVQRIPERSSVQESLDDENPVYIIVFVCIYNMYIYICIDRKTGIIRVKLVLNPTQDIYHIVLMSSEQMTGSTPSKVHETRPGSCRRTACMLDSAPLLSFSHSFSS